jgi:hypothetical protein
LRAGGASVFDISGKHLKSDLRPPGLIKAQENKKTTARKGEQARQDLVPGGCPPLNTATESDDGNPRLRGKAQQALHSWLDRLKSIVEEGQRMGEIRSAVRAAELAILIVTTLEGGLMVSRLQRKDDSLSLACRHLDQYLEATPRARKSRSGAEKS